MILAYPHFLWLLLLIPVVSVLSYRTSTVRRTSNVILRACCLAAVVLALGRPMLELTAKSEVSVLVVDLGPSMPTEVQAPTQRLMAEINTDGKHQLITVAFSNRAVVVADSSVFANPTELEKLRKKLALPVASDDPINGGSALAAALQLAGAQVPQDAHGTIVLYSNGLATRGDAESEAYRLAERGISVLYTTANVAAGGSPVAIVKSISVPSVARVGQTISAEVRVESKIAGDARVAIKFDGIDIASTVASVVPGINIVQVVLPLSVSGLKSLDASVAFESELTKTSNEIRAGAVQVGAPARILVVQDQQDLGTASALTNLLGKSAQIDVVSPADSSTQPLTDVGAVVLADLPADHLSGDAQTKLEQAVINGTGLVVTGAARSFGPGGYDDSRLASLLPVKVSQQIETIEATTTLVLIIDTSGSMEDFHRIDLAKEVARLAISHLRPYDKVGLVEFYGGKRWAAPIQSAGNTSVITRALNRLTAGGGTTLYPAIEEAEFALRNVKTRSKNILIISDGGVEDVPFAPILRQMADDGISISSVNVAPDPGPNVMANLARWGEGRFYLVPDRFEIPDISLKQPQISLLSPLVKNPSKLVAGEDSLVHSSEVASWAPVNGYVRTQAKTTSDVLLRTDSGDPLLVRWRYGAGYVVALPTQLGSTMTQNIQDQPGLATLIADLFRQIGQGQTDKLIVKPVARPAGLEVDVTIAGTDASFAGESLQLTLNDEHGNAVRTIRAEPIDSGHWNVLLPGVKSGAYSIIATLEGSKAQGRAGIAIPLPRVLARLTPDTALLNQLTSFNDLASRHAAMLPAKSSLFIDLTNYLATCALLLFLLHVVARRWPVSTKHFSRVDNLYAKAA